MIFFALVSCSHSNYPLQKNSHSTLGDPISDLSEKTGIPSGLHKFSLPQMVEGTLQQREYLVRFPLKPSRSSYPIIFYFHGKGGTASRFFKNLREVHKLIDNNQFIGIFPQGLKNSWNLNSEPSKADDVSWVKEVLEEISKLSFVKSSSAYAVGISNGAGLVNKLGKETDFFKGIAPLVSQQTVEMFKINSPRGRSLFQVNGDNDPLIPLEGGRSGVPHKFVSAKESAENWALYANCAIVPTSLEDNWGPYRVKTFFLR
jgi:poly(3-hydroxybutyrate) depolymerase